LSLLRASMRTSPLVFIFVDDRGTHTWLYLEHCEDVLLISKCVCLGP